MMVEKTAVEEAMSAKGLTVESKSRDGRKSQLKPKSKELTANFYQKQKEQVQEAKKKDENKIDHRYLDTLMFKHNRAQFLMKDTKLFDGNYYEDSFDISKEFAKQCHMQKDALPIPSIVI